MPQVGAAGEPVKEAACYGWDGSSWVKLSVNASGEAIIADCLIPTSLAQGQLAAAIADIYTVPASTRIANIEVQLFNSNTSTETVELALQRSGGTSRQAIQVDIDQDESYVWRIEGLSAGDKVRGNTDTAVKVNYFISGQVQT